LTNTLTNIRKSAGGHSGQGSCLYPQKAGPKVPESTQYQGFDVPTHLHTQEVTGSSPVVSTKKFLISQEIRNFSFASGSKSFLQIFYFFSDQYTDQFGDSFRRDTAPGEMILPSGVVFCCFMF